MSDTIMKFTKEELDSIQSLQQRYSQLTFNFGELYIEREAVQTRLNAIAIAFDKLKEELENVKNDERTLAKTLQMKYGDGQLNLQTGEFNPVKRPA